MAKERIRRWQGLDFYAVLSIQPDSSSVEVRQGFRKVAKTCHPDKVPPEEREKATKEFQLIAEAYEVLGSDSSRREYDEARRKAGFSVAKVKKAAPTPPKGEAAAGYPRKPPNPPTRWSWPAWCLDNKSPCIEVLVVDGSQREWMRGTPRARIIDPALGTDTYVNATYRWQGEVYSEDFGPERVRRRGETITVAELIRLGSGAGSPKHETPKAPSQSDKQPKAPSQSHRQPKTAQHESAAAAAAAAAAASTQPGSSQDESRRDEAVDKLDILLTMGFEKAQARDALERCTSLEAAVEDIMAQGAMSGGLGGYVAPAFQSFYDAIIHPAAKYIHGDVRVAELTSKLLDLGFDEAQARAAAERCSSVEAAVDWLQIS